MQPVPKEKKGNDYIYDFLMDCDNKTIGEELASAVVGYVSDKEVYFAKRMHQDGFHFVRTIGVRGEVRLEWKYKGQYTERQAYKIFKNYLSNGEIRDPRLVKSLSNGGLEIYRTKRHKDLIREGKDIINGLNDAAKGIDLDWAIKGMRRNKLTQSICGFGKGLLDEINYIEKLGEVPENVSTLLDWKSFSKLDNVGDIVKKADAAGNILGIADDVLTIFGDVYEHNYNPQTDDWNFTSKSVTNTVTDAAIDIAAGAGAAGIGAAVGSFFLPPVGTILGAGVGMVAGFAMEADFFDWDKDGEKDSLVDGAKKAVDSWVDKLFAQNA